MPFDPAVIVPAVAFLGYWLLALYILIRRGVRDSAIWPFMGYLGMSAVWTLSAVLSVAQLSVSWRWNGVAAYASVVTSAAMLLLAQTILQRRRSAQRWLLAGCPALAAALLFDPDILSPIRVGPWQIGGRWLSQVNLTHVILALAWGIFILGLVFISCQEYRRARGPLHRNCIRYLLLAAMLTIASDALYVSGASPQIQIASLLKLSGAMAIAYAIFSYRLLDVKQVYRKGISYAFITLITSVIFLLCILLSSVVFRIAWSPGVALGAAAVAVILALGYLPLRRAAQNLVDQFLFARSYEHNQVLQDYGERIADILDVERLAGVIIGAIDEALGIERGALLVAEGGDDGISKVRLKPYTGLGTVLDEIMEFGGSSPVLIHLRLKGLPLTQYELDFQNTFEKARQEELLWLRAMYMDVFVPIRAKERLIGVLALGAKRSGDPYFADDIKLLGTIADQTAGALENARFFGDLVMLNKVLSRAYTDLGRASRQLQEMDKLKSAFIGVITHELRSPFANITFSLQLLERYGQEHLPVEQRKQLEQLAAGVQLARTMVDNLVTFAAFLSKQGELRLAWLNFGEMVRDAVTPLQPLAENDGIALYVAAPDNLPSVYGDRGRLSDAVYHLVHNAIKFTPAGGKVWVRGWATSDAIYFEVKDTGVGVPAEKLPTLWEGFTQMADPLRRGVEGLGLGLALVKYIVNAHGGDVRVQSQEGVGSTFGFQVPFGEPVT